MLETSGFDWMIRADCTTLRTILARRPTFRRSIRKFISNSLTPCRITAMIAQPAESPLIGAAEDRVPRTESLVKDFSRRKLGVLSLEKSVQQLTLQATDVAGSQVADFRMLILRRQAEEPTHGK